MTAQEVAQLPATPVFRGEPDPDCDICNGTGTQCGRDYYGDRRWDRCECVRIPPSCDGCGALARYDDEGWLECRASCGWKEDRDTDDAFGQSPF